MHLFLTPRQHNDAPPSPPEKQMLENRPALLYNIPKLWHQQAGHFEKSKPTHMPTLNWIGKEAVVNHHLQVPFHLLKDVGCILTTSLRLRYRRLRFLDR
jgi:hypothetical protein